MRHLAKHMHDVTIQCTEVWCEDGPGTRNATEDPSEASCLECLRAAVAFGLVAFGLVASTRLTELQEDP